MRADREQEDGEEGGAACESESESEKGPAVGGTREWDSDDLEKVRFESATQGPWWARIGAGVPS